MLWLFAGSLCALTGSLRCRPALLLLMAENSLGKTCLDPQLTMGVGTLVKRAGGSIIAGRRRPLGLVDATLHLRQFFSGPFSRHGSGIEEDNIFQLVSRTTLGHFCGTAALAAGRRYIKLRRTTCSLTDSCPDRQLTMPASTRNRRRFYCGSTTRSWAWWQGETAEKAKSPSLAQQSGLTGAREPGSRNGEDFL